MDEDDESLYALGTIYENGLGVEADMDKAMDYYTQAADRGVEAAVQRLADLAAEPAA